MPKRKEDPASSLEADIHSRVDEMDKKIQALTASTPGSSFERVLLACEELEKKNAALTSVIKNYNEQMSTNIRGIWKGDIIGSNIIDRQINVEEILGSEQDADGNYVRILGEGTDNERTDKISPDQVENIKASIAKWGPHLNLIAYERVVSSRLFGLWENKEQYIVTCYDDQVLGMDDDGGNVALLCPGTIRYGRFEVPTGYPGRLKVMISEVHCLPWKDLNKNLISGISEITNKALEANPGYNQSVVLAEASKPITIKRGKDE